MAQIFHNPRCSKSRQTLALLDAQGVEFDVIEYLKTPPTVAELEALIAVFDGEPMALVRRKEAEFAESGLDQDSSAADVARAIARSPKLLERPVVVHGGRAVLGRPPENVLKLFA